MRSTKSGETKGEEGNKRTSIARYFHEENKEIEMEVLYGPPTPSNKSRKGISIYLSFILFGFSPSVVVIAASFVVGQNLVRDPCLLKFRVGTNVIW